jgi:hypothetical protein
MINLNELYRRKEFVAFLPSAKSMVIYGSKKNSRRKNRT